MEQPNLDPAELARKFAEMVEKPPLLPDPVFPRQNYLESCGRHLFICLLHVWMKPELVQQIVSRGADNRKAMLTVGWTGFWVFDFEHKSEQGVSGKTEFLERVKEPILRPPAQLAAIAAEHHILMKGVTKIQISTGNAVPGQYEVCELKTIGWYAAQIVSPGAKKP